MKSAFVFWMAWFIGHPLLQANPSGGTVTQGAATISTAGSTLTIKQSSANTVINWSSFNIGAGETTTFVQPSSSSVAWNNIGGGSASQILGNLNANGFVVLQNQAGFFIGGQGSINTHGLILTTSTAPPPSLDGGGAWSFSAPPPTAQIINYGQITTGGGPAFLIASDIENNGTISAPGGKIGLYAGEKVLVSTTPDGRGLSAEVTLPQGSVDNEGKLIADAGTIAAQAKVVNQNGLVQANSVQKINGVIELVASDSVNLGANSTISAQGGSSGVSAGGSVTIKSDNAFSDQPGSTINIAGGSQGGDGGQVEISAVNLNNFQTGIDGQAQKGFTGGTLILDPTELNLTENFVNSLTPTLNSSGLYQISLQASDDITLSTVWNLNDPGASALLSLVAGNNIILNDGSGINAGNNWSVNLTAGAGLAPGSLPISGTRNNGVYLDGDAFITAMNGDINVWAAHEVLINGGDIGGITTFGGGNINVTAGYGDVNTGNNIYGYDFGQSAAPYYSVDYSLGGISTAAGGNVTINAGGNVTSFLPIQTGIPQDYLNAQYDGGSGAFGPEAGNVTITAGGNVYGHYVVANGVGTITAGGNIGAPLLVLENPPDQGDGFALSLVKGSWNVYAPNGSIYVQDIRNPNGIFGEYSGSSANNYAGYHAFDYDASASVLLDAGDSVEITGYEAPHLVSSFGVSIPILLPPIMDIIAGSGGFILDTSVILFPSANQGLSITTLDGGNFGIPNATDPYSATPVVLEMSDSAATRWVGTSSFQTGDQPATSSELADPNPVNISISGSINAVDLYTTKATQITVGGDMINSGLVGENLHPSDVTSVDVAGKVYNSPIYTFVPVTQIASANPLQPSSWDSVFVLALNPNLVATLTSLDVNNANVVGSAGLASFLNKGNYLLFPSGNNSTVNYGSNPGFVYDSKSLQLGFKGIMSSQLSASQIAALEGGTFTVLVADGQGNPIVDVNGHLETRTYTFAGAPEIATLDKESSDSTLSTGIGFQIGGPGQLNIQASSIDLGDTAGIGSDGFGGSGTDNGGFNYSALKSLLPSAAEGGASVTVTVDGDLSMATSGIYSRDGGNVTVNAGGEIDLSQGSFVFATDAPFGIYTSGHSDVSVTANGNINVGSSRIASFNGGNVFVESLNGDVNAGTGANIALQVYGVYINPVTGVPTSVEFGDLTGVASLLVDPAPYGSGILAEYPTPKFQTAGGKGQPGNITVLTPHGNIVSSLGGISQFALDQSIFGGPTVTLKAGTPGVTGTPDQGNIDLGLGGVVGGTVDISAQGNVQGLIVSRQDANIDAAQAASVTVLSGGSANFGGGGSVNGLVVAVGGINVAGGGAVTATLLSQNVSVGGASQDTLGSSAGATTTSQSAAAEASNDAKQQTTADTTASDDEKKKKKLPILQRVKRVTVLLGVAAR